VIISSLITASKCSIPLAALGEEARGEARPDVLEEILPIGGVDQVGAGTLRGVKAASVEVTLRHPILGWHESIEVHVPTIYITQENHTAGRTYLNAPLIYLGRSGHLLPSGSCGTRRSCGRWELCWRDSHSLKFPIKWRFVFNGQIALSELRVLQGPLWGREVHRVQDIREKDRANVLICPHTD
jgi:hypothetical protein